MRNAILHPHRTGAIVVLFLLFLTFPLSLVFVFSNLRSNNKVASATSALGTSFTIENVVQVAQEIGVGGNNNTQAVDICGSDLGSMFDWNGKTYSVFGDTFGCPLSSNPPNWRSNALSFTQDTSPSDGITFEDWIKGADGKAKEIIPNDPLPGAQTAIPTYGVSVGGTGYLYYFEGRITPAWTCDYSSVAKSTNAGQTWAKLSNLKWDPGNFNQVAIYKKDGYVYFFGIPCARAGGVKMMRVLEGSIENKVSYEYLTGLDANSNPSWTANAEESAISIVSAPVGELSVRWNNYLGQYIMMYLKDVSPYNIELRSASNLWGPWSEPKTVTSGTEQPCLYAPYMKEGLEENNGQTVYFRMSRFCPGFSPYSTYLMKMTFNLAASPSPDPNLDSDADGCADTKELGTDWRKGGLRDPNNKWDFGDVPTPAIGTAPTSTKNKAIALTDVNATKWYVGTSRGGGFNPNGVRYDDDLNGNSVPDGEEYDRTPSAYPAKQWMSGPPNGAVTLQDVGVILAQVGTNCN